MPSLALLLFASSAQPLQGIVPNQLQHGEAYCASCRHLRLDRKSTRLNSSHSQISYAVFCLKKKNEKDTTLVLVAPNNMSAPAPGPLAISLAVSCTWCSTHHMATVHYMWLSEGTLIKNCPDA